MACRLPGADGLDEFWRLLVAGRPAWAPLPESRLPRDLSFDARKGCLGKSYSDLGGLVAERPVDPAACPITADMLRRYDVAHHIFLEVASLACRDAGLDPFAMPGDRRTGVYVGHTGGSTRIGDIVYGTRIDEAAALLAETDAARARLGADAAAVAAEVTAEIRGRYPGRKPRERLDLGAHGAARIVQEALGTTGPAIVVDAACASSLQALAMAARAIRAGAIDQAIVGGASWCKSDSLVLFSAAQSVSGTGSFPFGEQADGLVTAEGFVAVVIKPLSHAVANGDRIRAVIRGIGVASDGKGKSLWAPLHAGQQLAIERAYADPTDLGRLDLIEAHATSTRVGDATELEALQAVIGPHVPAAAKIPIGSVKAVIGHTLESAGLASLVKVVLAMEHGVIPPGTTAEQLTTDFNWDHAAFEVPRGPRPWPRHANGRPRQAAVNAFGIGGLNVHVSLAEHVVSPAAPAHRVRPPASIADLEPIAIVGLGCVLPGSLTLDAFYARLARGETAVGLAPKDRWDASRGLDSSGPRTWHATSATGGFIRGFAYDWRKHKVPPKQIVAANPLQFMLLDAADAALAMTNVATLDRDRTAVVVGTLFGGDFSNDLQVGLRLPETTRSLRAAMQRRGVSGHDGDEIIAAYERTVLARMPALLDETGSFTSSTLASRLTKSFDLHGGALALDAGGCSTAAALATAADMLRSGDCTTVVCAAGQRSLDLVAFEGLSLMGKLAPGADGGATDDEAFIPGEAAVVFVLKTLAAARAAGDTVHGLIRSVAVTSREAATHSARHWRDTEARQFERLIGHAGAAAAAVRIAACCRPDDAVAQTATIVSEEDGLVGVIEMGAQTRPMATTRQAGRRLAAAVFPGQGSQYGGMFRGLVADVAAVRGCLDELDGLARGAGYETLADVAWQDSHALGVGIWETQWSMFLGDLLAWKVLESLGFVPDLVASHSFGEFPALVAAGAWSFAEGARCARARASAVARLGPKNGALVSVIADRATVAEVIAPLHGMAWICADNAPEQVVVGGATRTIDAVEVLLEARQLKSKRLAVPSPFHTPLMGAAAVELAATIREARIVRPPITTFSSTTAAEVATAAEIGDSIVRQMTDTVEWVKTVERLYAAGVRTFVEVGPSATLSGLLRRILAGREDVSIIQFDQRSREGTEQIARLREQLAAAGCLRDSRPTPRPAGVVAFDATARRRSRNRAGGQLPASASPALAAAPAAQTEARRTESADMAEDIETFLIDFVVEQTGYPREIVALDADLEADLGIDSIRKAQLFGEVGQKYGLSPDDTTSLDEFPTLRHLRDYLRPRLAPATPAQPSAASAAPCEHEHFDQGKRIGAERAAEIRRWVRRAVAAPDLAVATSLRDEIREQVAWAADACVQEECFAAHVAGVAEGAGVDDTILRAAWDRPSVGRQGAPVADVTRRYRLAMMALAAPSRHRTLVADRGAIIGESDTAQAIAEVLQARGADVSVIPAAAVDQVTLAVERFEAAGPIRHLVVATPWSADRDAWKEGRDAGLITAYFACQRWIACRRAAGDLDRATLTAVTNGGGEFGLAGGIGAVESGGLAGLLKGIARECPELHVRVVDHAAADSPADIADRVVSEMTDGPGPVEIGYAAGRRQTVVVDESPCPAMNGHCPTALDRGSVWLVTGGARGVTAACARMLARKHGLTLALVGSTHLSDAEPAFGETSKASEIARTLAACAADGVQARYYRCDIAEAGAVDELVARVAAEVGPIRGLIHGAGYESACRFEKKTRVGLDATLGPKCLGFTHLMRAIASQPVEMAIAFGSTSGRFGGHGQADYSLANEMLAKQVVEARRTRPSLKAAVIHWHAWDEVGMAARPESRFVLERFGLRFMPLAEGVRRFMNEVEAGLPDAEVVITEPVTVPRPATVAQPTRLDVVLDPVVDPFLTQHRQHGRPLLPAAMGLELVARAASVTGGYEHVAEISDFVVERPLLFRTDEPRTMAFETQAVDGGIDVRGLAADHDGEAGAAIRVHVRGVVSDVAAALPTAAMDDPPFPLNPMIYPDDAGIWHGGPFRTLEALFLDRRAGWGRLIAPDPLALDPRAAGHTVPVALLDGCFVACAVYSYWMCGKRVELPVGCGRLRLLGQPLVGEICSLRLCLGDQTAKESVYAFVVCGGDGRPLLAVDGLRLVVASDARRP